MTGKQNTIENSKLKWVENGQRNEKAARKGGREGREKCYNSDLLSGVRSVNYSEMWTACQC